MSEQAGPLATTAVNAPTEKGWGKLLLALVAFLFVPSIPQFRALLPIDRTMLLLVPALAACCLVGWWAGGRALLALAWVALATLLAVQTPPANDAFYNLARGWSLLLAGSFGLVCLFGSTGAFFPRALAALGLAMLLALIMSSIGPVTPAEAHKALADELARRNVETMTSLNSFISSHPKEWQELTASVPQLAALPGETEKQLKLFADKGLIVFPALLALQSLAALALAWTTYHRLGRARLGKPLGQLREFRFNDQLVWGLIVGLTVMFLPTLSIFRGVGRNSLLFFGALYAVRGLGVLSWFLSPGALTAIVTIGFAMSVVPVLGIVAVAGFLALAVAAFGLGLGDTWADWRNKARPTT